VKYSTHTTCAVPAASTSTLGSVPSPTLTGGGVGVTGFVFGALRMPS
jgi:hypothetical protein